MVSIMDGLSDSLQLTMDDHQPELSSVSKTTALAMKSGRFEALPTIFRGGAARCL
jgi:hypothetical protein